MSDYIIKAITEDGQARAFVATTKDMVNEAARRHEMSPVAIVASGRLFTAGAMMGTMMKNDKDLLTVRIKGNGPIGQLTVTADPKGNIKGFVGNPQVMLPLKDGRIDVAGALGIGVLSVTKDLGLKEPYIGDTILVTSEIGDDLTYYFATSEQTPSAVGLGVMVDTDSEVKHAGGFIIQMMPDVAEETIEAIEAKLKDAEPVTTMMEKGMSPEDILEYYLGGLDLHINEKLPVEFYCDCSKEKVARALATISTDDLNEIINDGEEIEVKCYFCNSAYKFQVDELKEMIAQR